MLLLGAVAWWAMMRKPIVRRRARRWSCDAGPPDPLAHPRVTREIRSTRCPEQDLPGASSWRTGKEPSDDGLTERLRGTPGHAETLRDVVGVHERFRHAHRREPRRVRHVPVPGNGTGPRVGDRIAKQPTARSHHPEHLPRRGLWRDHDVEREVPIGGAPSDLSCVRGQVMRDVSGSRPAAPLE